MNAPRNGFAFTLPCLLLTAALAAPAPAAAVGEDLLPAHVECARSQLDAFLARAALDPAPPGPAITDERNITRVVFATYSNPFGFLEGVVARTEWPDDLDQTIPETPETLLSFHLNPDVRQLLLNPERPTLGQVSLTREDSTSVLVEAPSRRALVLSLDPTLQPRPVRQPGDLVIDNVLEAVGGNSNAFRPADTAPGRGLVASGVTALCHTRFTSFDRRMFAILQRVLRFTVEPLGDLPPDTRRPDLHVALYRSESPSVFMADVTLLDPFDGTPIDTDARRRLNLALTTEPDGDVTGLTLSREAFPAGSPWFVTAHLARPGFDAGLPTVLPLASLSIHDLPPLPFPPIVEVSWDALLGGTTWAPRSMTDAACGQGTAAEIAATPRFERNTELLALAMGDGLTADGALFERLFGDLTAIRRFEPELEDVEFFTQYDAKTLMLTVEDQATAEAIAAGEYDAWDCLNEHYELEFVQPLDPIPRPDPRLIAVRLEGFYHLETIAPDYADLPGISSAVPFTEPPPAAPTGTFRSLCAREEGDTIHYYLQTPLDDHPAETATWYYTSEPGEEPISHGVYNPAVPVGAPGWHDEIDPCYDALRFGRRG